MLSRTSLCISLRILPKRYNFSQRCIHGSPYITNHIGNVTIKTDSHHKILRRSPVLCSSFIRFISNDGLSSINQSINHQSTSTPVTDNIFQNITTDPAPSNLLDQIPDAPLPPTPEILDLAAPLVEPTFASLGLAGWSPAGIVRQILEVLHVSCGIPWWATITIGTVVVRSLMFPLVIIQMKNMAKMHNCLPGMQKIQMKLTEARLSGDQFQAVQYTQDLAQYMAKHNFNPLKSMIVPIVQSPIFLSFYLALRKMTNLPVESMTRGGLYWFKDLTVTDPYFLLPIITSTTLAITFKLGIDGPKLATMGMMRYVVQAIPLIVFPITMNFPVAIVWYWVSTNIFSMIQTLILKIPKIRNYFNIPEQIVHSSNEMPKPKKFKEGFKDSWKNMKMTREMVDRQQLDMVQFNKAGRGPIPKTYAYNPRKIQLKQSQTISK